MIGLPLWVRQATAAPTMLLSARPVPDDADRMACSVLGRGAEPPQFWVLLI